jgi:hypothetical protein
MLLLLLLSSLLAFLLSSSRNSTVLPMSLSSCSTPASLLLLQINAASSLFAALLPSVAVTFSKTNIPLQHQATPLDLLPLVAVRTARQGKNPAAARRCCVASLPSSS